MDRRSQHPRLPDHLYFPPPPSPLHHARPLSPHRPYIERRGVDSLLASSSLVNSSSDIASGIPYHHLAASAPSIARRRYDIIRRIHDVTLTTAPPYRTRQQPARSPPILVVEGPGLSSVYPPSLSPASLPSTASPIVDLFILRRSHRLRRT